MAPAPPTVVPPVAVPPAADTFQQLTAVLASVQTTSASLQLANTELLIGYSHLASVRGGLVLLTLARNEALRQYSLDALSQPMTRHLADRCVNDARLRYNVIVAPACNISAHLMSALNLSPFDLDLAIYDLTAGRSAVG